MSKFTLSDFKNRANQQKLKLDFEDYLNGFSKNVQDIIENFEFRNQIPKLSKADALGSLIEKFLDPSIDLSPDGLDNHDMGTIFEELVRRFNEENNEEAGEHWTPRDAVKLMANLIFLPIADQIESGTYLLYDGACGTGGMLTVAEETLQALAHEHGKQVATHLFGQEINSETYAICKADLLLKGEGAAADNIVGGPAYSTLSNDAFPTREFDFMLSNPPYGKSWKTDKARMSDAKGNIIDPRFVIEHNGDPEYSLVTRSSDGQMLFLANMVDKRKRDTLLGSRIAEVHNGSSLFTGDAGQGESNIRRWIIENDWLEAIIALPLNMFYNTGIATYIWVLSNRKPENRRGYVQLVDATKQYTPLRKNLGEKNCELSENDIAIISQAFLDFEEFEATDEIKVGSKIFPNENFGYWKVTVERPLRLTVNLTDEALTTLYATCEENGEQELYQAVNTICEEYGVGPFTDYNAFLVTLENAFAQRLTKKREKLLRETLTTIDENAEPVVSKTHKPGDVGVDRLYGFFARQVDGKSYVVEYEPDTALRDSEQIPLLEDGGIPAFIEREVWPYVPDAWVDESAIKIGYEISFTRYFYKPEPLRPLDEIRQGILALEQETDGLLESILNLGKEE